MDNTLLFISLSLTIALLIPIFRQRGIPVAPINILLGIALGPFFLELLKVNTAVIDLMELAVIFLLFSVGLRIHWQSFRQAIWPGIRIGLSSIFLSAILGGTAVYLLNNRAHNIEIMQDVVAK